MCTTTTNHQNPSFPDKNLFSNSEYVETMNIKVTFGSASALIANHLSKLTRSFTQTHTHTYTCTRTQTDNYSVFPTVVNDCKWYQCMFAPLCYCTQCPGVVTSRGGHVPLLFRSAMTDTGMNVSAACVTD